jgi:hypothetical protein
MRKTRKAYKILVEKKHKGRDLLGDRGIDVGKKR